MSNQTAIQTALMKHHRRTILQSLSDMGTEANRRLMESYNGLDDEVTELEKNSKEIVFKLYEIEKLVKSIEILEA